MYEQVDFHFRYQPGSGSPYALLLKYLQPKKKGSKTGRGRLAEPKDDSREFPTEQMVLWALSAFWYPSACKALGDFSNAALRQKARNAIYQLLQQIYYLIQLFDLDPQEFVLPTSTGALNSGLKVNVPATAVMIDETATAASSAPPPAAKTEEEYEAATSTLVLAPTEDDIALDEAFDN